MATRWPSRYVAGTLATLHPAIIHPASIHPATRHPTTPQCDGGYGGPDCTPGCYPPAETCDKLGRKWGCSYAPWQLKTALSSESYTWNEIVVDTRCASRRSNADLPPSSTNPLLRLRCSRARSIDENLPLAILAFFHIPGSDPQKARDTRARFMQTYVLEADVAPPVVKLDLSRDPVFTLLAA